MLNFPLPNLESKFLPFLYFPVTIVPYSTHRWKLRCRAFFFSPWKDPSRIPGDCHIIWALSEMLVGLPGNHRWDSSLHSLPVRTLLPQIACLFLQVENILFTSIIRFHEGSSDTSQEMMRKRGSYLPKGNILFSVSIAKNDFKRSLFRLFVLSSIQAWQIALESSISGD